MGNCSPEKHVTIEPLRLNKSFHLIPSSFLSYEQVGRRTLWHGWLFNNKQGKRNYIGCYIGLRVTSLILYDASDRFR